MNAIEEIKKVIPQVERYVKQRMNEFERLGREGKTHFDFRPFLDIDYDAGIFSELCFCILTANSSATLGIKIQASLGDEGFMNKSEEELTQILSSFGHRYAQQRARRIVEAREKFGEVLSLIRREKNPKVIRELLADPKSRYKIKGFGYKEASHFLRNIGFKDVAIIDRHISRFLMEKGFLRQVKTITRKVYLEAEKALEGFARELGLTLGELDLYIFYIKTKKVLK
ncbi:N-glycosylase/DNA lyase [Aquifex pyrophilus]